LSTSSAKTSKLKSVKKDSIFIQYGFVSITYESILKHKQNGEYQMSNEKIERLVKMSVKEIFVYWSESTMVNKCLGSNNGDINRTISLDYFADLCRMASEEVDGGYDKTKFKVVFHDGTEKDCLRIDICKSENNPIEVISHYI